MGQPSAIASLRFVFMCALIAWWCVTLSIPIVASVVFRYLALRKMNRRAARLMLQDMFWLETRREQERIYHWRNWYKKNKADSTAGGS